MTTEEQFHQNRVWLFEKAGLDPHARWPKGTMGWRHTLCRKLSVTKHQLYKLLYATDFELSWETLQQQRLEKKRRRHSQIVSKGNKTKAKMRRSLRGTEPQKETPPWTMRFEE